MSEFTLHLLSPTKTQQFTAVQSFIGEDTSGSFGLLANHARFMTALVFGLARFRPSGQPWQFLAVPGALVYFKDNHLYLTARRYLISDDVDQVTQALTDEFYQEERELQGLKQSLHEMEQTMLRRLWELRRWQE